jgi:hypothetical protein
MAPPNEHYEPPIEKELRELLDAVMSTPLSAYRLGFLVYPLYAWLDRENLAMWQGARLVGLANPLSRQALLVLADQIHAGRHRELREALSDIAELHDGIWTEEGPLGRDSHPARREGLLDRARRRWAEYRHLVGSALPKAGGDRYWLDFGLTAGEYTWQLWVRYRQLGRRHLDWPLPDQGPLLRRGREMSAKAVEEVRRILRVLDRSVAPRGSFEAETYLAAFDSFRRRVEGEEDSRRSVYEEIDLMNQLDRALEVALQNGPVQGRVAATPRWDRKGGRLTFGEDQARDLKTKKATSITPVLDHFQALGWPEEIDFPPPGYSRSSGITDVVSSLNDGLKHFEFYARGGKIVLLCEKILAPWGPSG